MFTGDDTSTITKQKINSSTSKMMSTQCVNAGIWPGTRTVFINKLWRHVQDDSIIAF